MYYLSIGNVIMENKKKYAWLITLGSNDSPEEVQIFYQHVFYKDTPVLLEKDIKLITKQTKKAFSLENCIITNVFYMGEQL